MTRSILAAAAAAIAFAAQPAHAADIPRGPSPYVTAPYLGYNWSGFYLGLNLGYQWSSITNSGFKPDGLAGGLQGGYNWQTGNFVLGLEADMQLSGADDTIGPLKFSTPWFGTFRGRGGVAFNNVLAYVTGGLAYGAGQIDFGGLSERHSQFGWTIGGGVEVGLTRSWSAKAEYLYVDLSSSGYALTGLPHEIQSSVFRMGGNYRF